MTTPGRRPPKARPVLPTAVTAVAAVLTAVGAFLPWYAPDTAPPLTPNSVSGWDATFAAKLLVVAALAAALAAGVLLLDAVQRMALDATGVRALAVVSAVGMGVAAVLAVLRTARLPEPADLLSRQIGLYVALAAAAVGLAAALVQLMFAMQADDRGRAHGRRTRRR